jgi:hypothetical protein
VVCAGTVRGPNHHLPVSVPVVRFGRPLTHSAHYISYQIIVGRSLGLQGAFVLDEEFRKHGCEHNAAGCFHPAESGVLFGTGS